MKFYIATDHAGYAVTDPVCRVWTQIDDLMSSLCDEGFDSVFYGVTCVVCGDVEFHGFPFCYGGGQHCNTRPLWLLGSRMLIE